MKLQDNLFTASIAAHVACDVANSAEFNESLLGDEATFMFYNFPVHSTPSDDEVIARFEETLEAWASESHLVDVLTNVAKAKLAEV